MIHDSEGEREGIWGASPPETGPRTRMRSSGLGLEESRWGEREGDPGLKMNFLNLIGPSIAKGHLSQNPDVITAFYFFLFLHPRAGHRHTLGRCWQGATVWALLCLRRERGLVRGAPCYKQRERGAVASCWVRARKAGVKAWLRSFSATALDFTCPAGLMNTSSAPARRKYVLFKEIWIGSGSFYIGAEYSPAPGQGR